MAPRGYVSLESGLELHVHPLWRLFCGRGTPPYGGAITLYGPFTVTSISFPKIATTGVKRERQEREQSAFEGGRLMRCKWRPHPYAAAPPLFINCSTPFCQLGQLLFGFSLSTRRCLIVATRVSLLTRVFDSGSQLFIYSFFPLDRFSIFYILAYIESIILTSRGDFFYSWSSCCNPVYQPDSTLLNISRISLPRASNDFYRWISTTWL